MDRLLIVPAAGRGTRLGALGPKALVQVAGRPMLDHLLALHQSNVDRAVVIVAPTALEAFAAFVHTSGLPIDLVVQPEPTGMLDAITAAKEIVTAYEPRRIAVTWCDQIAVTPSTIRRLIVRVTADDAPDLVFPTISVEQPYIHFERDKGRRIVGVRQRREGDEMPSSGETDMGLFDLSRDAYLRDLRLFAETTTAAAGTGERNFLPFIPWLAARRTVETVSGSWPLEAIGINTPEERSAIEAFLLRDGSRD
jgi:bifunctional UDP-N-acetylglucosamine pyrophosphorylase/glucosamine-1-phosphate N-acetyltransferase